MVRSLDKKWKEFLFAFSGFGPNLLMVLMGAYFTDAINPSAMLTTTGVNYQIFASKACYILPAVFPILYAISKAFDGIIDVPFAHITDTLSTKWGRRRPAIAVCFLPMVISYVLCWIPIGGPEGQLLNTIWIVFWSLVFFSTYTMCLIAFYGSLSSVCESEPQRLRVSTYKSFFDTISYCLVYALVPLLLGATKLHIDKFVLFCGVPLMLTMIIPLFMIKEGAKYGYPEDYGEAPKKVTFKESLALTFKNKTFVRWLIVNCCTYFGLQMFLVGMNAMIIGGMGMNGGEMAILNTCAFAPVPIMLYLFNKLKAKKGIRFAYQTCLVGFAIAILSFFFGSTLIMGDNKMAKMIIGCVGGVCGSWAIGSFFMMPYHITAQIASVEEQLTKKNHSAMYFAANALFTSIVGAISGSLIYETIKNLFFSTEGGVVWAKGTAEGGVITDALTNAATSLGVDPSTVFNLGTTIVPFIVAATCILGVILAFKMPKDYTPAIVAKELKKQNPDLDISSVENDDEFVKEEKGEILFVQIGLSILSGFIFGFIWPIFMLKDVKTFTDKKFNRMGLWALSCFVPFASIYTAIKADNVIVEKINALGGNAKSSKVLFIIFGIIFPILPVNLVTLSILQHKVNKVYKLEGKAE
ncbi:MAG: MFS transporter [Clostridia bacterium]|nr:MFS transporter [Clostridia bacterium]